MKQKSLRQLAQELGVSASYLSQVRHGKRPASAKLLNALASIKQSVKQCVKHGAKQSYLSDSEPGGIRTHDPRIKSPLLYQLSYRPLFSFATPSIYYVVSGSQRVVFVLTSRGFDVLILSLG